MNTNADSNHSFAFSETRFLPRKTAQPFKCVKDSGSCVKKTTKTFPRISTNDNLVPNQFFVASCLTCPQDQTTAVPYYSGQNTSTNSYFLQPTDGRKHHWQQFSLVLRCSTFREQLPLILNEECNKAIPHVWTLSCCWDMQPPGLHVKIKDEGGFFFYLYLNTEV